MGGLLPPAEVTPRPGSSSTGAGSGVVAVRHPGSGPTESGSNPGRAPEVLWRARFRPLGPPESYRHPGERVVERPARRNRCAGAPNQYRSTGSARTTWYERLVAQPWGPGLRSGYAPDQRPSRGARGPHRSDPRHWLCSRQEYAREAVAEVPPLRNCDHALRVRRVRRADGREALVSPPFGNARDAEPSPPTDQAPRPRRTRPRPAGLGLFACATRSSTSPRRSATVAASTRPETPSLARMFPTWTPTVFSLM